MGCIAAKATRIDGIEASAHSIGNTSDSTSHSIGNINVTASLVCSVGTNKFIRVTPTEPMWIDVGFSINYYIESNTNWNIK